MSIRLVPIDEIGRSLHGEEAIDGAYHHHDMNTTTTEHVCSRGHHWTESHRKSCPSCGWGKP